MPKLIGEGVIKVFKLFSGYSVTFGDDEEFCSGKIVIVSIIVRDTI